MPAKKNRELAVAVALFAVFGPTSPAFAQEPQSSPTRNADAEPLSTHVELVTDTLPRDIRAAVEIELDGQLAAAVDDLGLVVAASESAELVLRVEVGQPNRKAPVYVVHSVALHDGQVLERGDAQTCLRCTPAELVGEGLAILPKAAARALAARPELEQAEPAPAPALVDAEHRLPKRVSPPGPTAYLGIALGAIGLVSAVAGGVLLNREDVMDDATGAPRTDYGAPGIALLSTGLTSMVTGTALLVVDIWVLAPNRANRQARVELSYGGLRF